MKTTGFYLWITLLLAPFPGSAQNAREISRKASDAIDMTAMEMAATLKILDNKGNERIRKTATATREFNGVVKTIIRFISPPDVQGTAILIHDYKDKPDDMWIYMPALRKDRRIVSSEKGKSFMGSEFTNADMSKPNLDDFDYKILGTEQEQGKECWKVESVCRDATAADELGYRKKISWIEKESYLVYKIMYYDREGNAAKIQLISDYRKQPGGKYFAFCMEMKNMQTGRRSVMVIDKFQSGSKMPESAFSPAMLAK